MIRQQLLEMEKNSKQVAMKKRNTFHLKLFLYAWIMLLLPLGVMAQGIPRVTIDFFYTSGCSDCRQVDEEILPELRERFEGFYDLNHYNLINYSNILVMIAYQNALNITEDESVCMVVDYKHVFNGLLEIKEGLFKCVNDCIAAGLAPGRREPEPILVDGRVDKSMANIKMRTFTVWTIITAGLIDGINPCSFSTIIFFMSLLAVFKVKGRSLMLLGVSFCLASFVTYLAIGFGLLHLIYMLEGFAKIKVGVETTVMIALGVLAYLSFRDAYNYRKTGKTGDVILQMPNTVKKGIHGAMRKGLNMGSITAGGLFAGICVTVLESVCTGQMYVPVLVIVISSGVSRMRALLYLLLYNLMFIVPLTTVFIVTYFGTNTTLLIEWSKKNVTVSKVLMGMFFIIMAVLVVLL